MPSIEDYTDSTREWLRIIGGIVEKAEPDQRDALWTEIMITTLDKHPDDSLADAAAAAIAKNYGQAAASEESG